MVTMFRGTFYNACSASIIAKNLILTASHCISNYFDHITVRSGSNYQITDGTIHRIVSYVHHENYSLNYLNDLNGKLWVNDIAIAQVEPPFEFDASHQPISLYNADEVIKPELKGEVCGWGYMSYTDRSFWTDEEEFLHKLNCVTVPIYEKSTCAAEYMKQENYTLKSGQICAGRYKGDCAGDFGGPLVVDGRLAGIVSWVYRCGYTEYPPVVFTEIAYFRNWIDTQVEKLSGTHLAKVDVTEKSINRSLLQFHHGQYYYEDKPIWS
ncbi:trypsin delta-like [Phymastichus coffea]|uniref:trypsin delta-like n=1 Tax=Phymastichus coffea TaxID=108790 RepID=UPI00273B0FD1|nr:trypsin delta-like [Phymastichus coffea]